MPPIALALPPTFETITYGLLAVSILVSITLGLKLFRLQSVTVQQMSGQDENLRQLIAMSERSATDTERRLHDHHHELLRAGQAQTVASHETLRAFQGELLARVHSTTQQMVDRVGRFEHTLDDRRKADFDRLEAKIEAKLDGITRKVVEDFEANLKTSQQAFHDVVERLARIDAAQQKIEDLSRNVVSLQDVLSDKKTRGTFGETQLNHILAAVFGHSKNGGKAQDKRTSGGDSLYSLQHTLPNKRVADAMLHLPEPVGNLAVDSKFPLENYQRMMNRNAPLARQQAAAVTFGRDFKKHIDTIAERYILPSYTSNQAILFLPAEAIFAEIHSHHGQLIDYAHSKRVWIVSPTTFMAQLSTIQMVVANLSREKYAHIIQEELVKLATEFDRYKDRWTKLGQQLSTVSKSVSDLSITSDKITKRFQQINSVNL